MGFRFLKALALFSLWVFAVDVYAWDFIDPTSFDFAGSKCSFVRGDDEFTLIKIDPPLSATSVDLAVLDARAMDWKDSGMDHAEYFKLDRDFFKNSFASPAAITRINVPDRASSPFAGAEFLNRFTGCTAYTMTNSDSVAVSVSGGVVYKYGGRHLGAFPAAKSAASFKIPDTVTRIDKAAFMNAKKLTGVVLPKGLKTIESKAFYNSGLKTVNDLATSPDISYDAFRNTPWWTGHASGSVVVCSGVALGIAGTVPAEVAVPATVREVCNYAFGGYRTIRTVSLPSSVKKLGREAFRDCAALNRVNFSEGLQEIGADAFTGTALMYFTIPRSVVDVRYESFADTPWMTKYGNVEQVVKNGCLLCVNTTKSSLTVLDSVRVVADGAICSDTLRSIVFPASLKILCGEAVCCDWLEQVTFRGDCPKTTDRCWFGDEVTVRIPAGADGWLLDWDGFIYGSPVVQPSGTGRLLYADVWDEVSAIQYVLPNRVYKLASPKSAWYDFGSSRLIGSNGRVYDHGVFVFGLVKAGGDFRLTAKE